MERIFGLDYLRGMSALLIVFYHFNSWSFHLENTNTLTRFGIYGVAIFYILSGLTLYNVYKSKLNTVNEVFVFFQKRIFRLFPLLWLVTILTIFGSSTNFTIERICLNFSGLFSFFSYNSYIAGGAWSIGNELVFYSVFPIILISFRKHYIFYWLYGAITLGLLIYFAFFLIKPIGELSNQWHIYIHPLNQVFYFVIGILIGVTFKQNVSLENKNSSYLIILISLIIFIIYPVNTKIELIHGNNRLIFSALCVLMTFGFYKLKKMTFQFLHVLLNWIGEISYTIYLMHPIVWNVTKRLLNYFNSDNWILQFSISLAITFFASHLIYNFYEKKIVHFSNMLINKKKNE